MKRLAILLAPAVCWAATTSVTVDELIGMARSASGEFAAEALIRIAGIDKVEKPRRIALLEEAFGRAGEAQLPYRRRAAITRVPGPASIFNRVYSQGLDAMSLRLKAVNAMIPLDPVKAREMFRRIPPIRLPRLTCEEYLVYDVDGFYSTLSRVASQTFTPAEIEKGEPFRLLQPYLASAGSAVEIPAAARLIAASNVSDKDFPGLMSAFAKAMSGISGDDRSFTYAETGPPIRALVEEARRRQAVSTPLLEAYRGYLVNNMSAARCADNDMMYNSPQAFAIADAGVTEQQGPDPAAYFNGRLRVPPLEDIQEQEVTPSKLEGVASGLRGCDDDVCKAIAQKYLDLIFDSRRNPYPASHKETPEWQKQLQEFLASLAAWQPRGESYATEHFLEKSAYFSDVANVSPTAAGREAVLRAELEYVRKAKASVENRVEWFLPVNLLIGRVTLDPLGTGKLTGDLRGAGDPVIVLFLELEAMAPRTPDQIMPLM
jgi:hypothetical protein